MTCCLLSEQCLRLQHGISTLQHRKQGAHLHARIICMPHTCSWMCVKGLWALVITACQHKVGIPAMDALPSCDPWLLRLV